LPRLDAQECIRGGFSGQPIFVKAWIDYLNRKRIGLGSRCSRNGLWPEGFIELQASFLFTPPDLAQIKSRLEGDGKVLLEETVEELQSEIISDCMVQWRRFKRTNRNKRPVIELGVKIFGMLVKYKASEMDLKELKMQLDTLRTAGVMLLET